MKAAHLVGVAGGLLCAAALCGAACTYNTYIIEGTSAGSGGGSTTSSSSGGTGGSSGTGGAASSSSGASSGSGACSTDADNDMHVSQVCGGDDCADNDDRAHPGQAMYYPTPINQTMSYDFNCNGAKEYEITEVLKCDAVNCDQKTVKWVSTVPDCGQMGQFGVCKLGVPCTNDIQGSKPQACH